MNNTAIDSKFINVHRSKLHYLEAGKGATFVFVHGVPTSSTLWKQVIELLAPHCRCIALDLVGMGQSDKPDIEYSAADYVHYLAGFIEALALEEVNLVMHGWGSVATLAYAMSHQDKVKGLVMYESYIRPVLDWSMMSLPMQELAAVVNEKEMEEKIATTDYFIENLLPRAILNEMPIGEAEEYKLALAATKNRQPLVQYLKELPTGSEPAVITQLIKDYSQKLQHSSIPKLLIYGVPGYNTTMSSIAWAKDHLPNLTLVDIGPVLHFAPKTNSTGFAEAVSSWLTEREAVDQ